MTPATLEIAHSSRVAYSPRLLRHVVMAYMDVQVGVFSATLPPEALEITRKFMNKPVRAPCPCTDHSTR